MANMDAITEIILQRFDRTDSKLERIEVLLDSQAERLTRTESEIIEIKASMSALSETKGRLEERITGIEKRVDAFEKSPVYHLNNFAATVGSKIILVLGTALAVWIIVSLFPDLKGFIK